MFTRCVVHLTREGWYYGIVLTFIIGGAVLREVNLLFVLAAVMIGPLFFSWRFARNSLAGLSVKRVAPLMTHVGETVTVRLELTNERSGSSSWTVAVHDVRRHVSPRLSVSWPGETEVERDKTTRRGGGAPEVGTVLFPHVAPRSTQAREYRWTPTRRGRYAWDAVTVSTRFPFGFLEASFRQQLADTVVVAPRIGRLTQQWRRYVDGGTRGEDASSQRRGLREGDYYGLREWRPGDSRRWIHWRTSARQGSLTTLQFEDPRQDDWALVVDLWAPRDASWEQLARVEQALSLAATIVVEQSRSARRGLRVGLAGSVSRAWPQPINNAHRWDILAALAEMEPSENPDWFAALPLPSHRSFQRQVIVVSTRSPVPEFDGRGQAGQPDQFGRAARSPLADSSRWLEVDSALAASLFESSDRDSLALDPESSSQETRP